MFKRPRHDRPSDARRPRLGRHGVLPPPEWNDLAPPQAQAAQIRSSRKSKAEAHGRSGERLARALDANSAPPTSRWASSSRPAPTSSAPKSRATLPNCKIACRHSAAEAARQILTAELGATHLASPRRHRRSGRRRLDRASSQESNCARNEGEAQAIPRHQNPAPQHRTRLRERTRSLRLGRTPSRILRRRGCAAA